MEKRKDHHKQEARDRQPRDETPIPFRKEQDDDVFGDGGVTMPTCGLCGTERSVGYLGLITDEQLRKDGTYSLH